MIIFYAYRICRNKSPGQISDVIFQRGGVHENWGGGKYMLPQKISFETINALGVYFGKYGI